MSSGVQIMKGVDGWYVFLIQTLGQCDCVVRAALLDMALLIRPWYLSKRHVVENLCRTWKVVLIILHMAGRKTPYSTIQVATFFPSRNPM